MARLTPDAEELEDIGGLEQLVHKRRGADDVGLGLAVKCEDLYVQSNSLSLPLATATASRLNSTR